MIGLLLAAWAFAAPPEPLPPEQPPRELLEFLGSFEDEDGRWIDPMELPEPPPGEADAPKPDEDENDHDSTADTDPGAGRR